MNAIDALASWWPWRGARGHGDPAQRGVWWLAGMLVVTLLAGVVLGAYPVSPDVVRASLDALVQGETLDVSGQVLWNVRLPRVLLGALCGAALALGGCVLQGLFRNPLADPALIGLSSGAALAAALAIVFGQWLPLEWMSMLKLFLMPMAAMAGAALAVLWAMRIASHQGTTSVIMLLLAGIAANALCQAGIGALQFVASDEQLRNITFWTLGSLGQARWAVVGVVGLAVLAGVLMLRPLHGALDALNLGEAAARHLGVDVQGTKRRLVAAVTLMVGACIAFTGVIVFVGLVAPHLVRMALGPSHRHAMPASALLGAILLVAADVVARTVAAPAEVPIGILTAFIGTPFFVWLIRRRRMGMLP